MSETEELLLQLDELPLCPRCGGAVLLQARFSHVWTNSRGEEVAGVRESLLCPACDRGEPAADQLLALFAVDEQLNANNSSVFAGLGAAWVESVRSRNVEAAITAEHEQWRRGEL